MVPDEPDRIHPVADAVWLGNRPSENALGRLGCLVGDARGGTPSAGREAGDPPDAQLDMAAAMTTSAMALAFGCMAPPIFAGEPGCVTRVR